MITRAPRRHLHGAVAAGKSLLTTWKRRSPALSPGHFTVPPWTRSSLYPLGRATRKAARVTSPSASTDESPLAVASNLESSSRHLDPSDAVAMARGSLSPPQLDTRATAGAHRELAAGRSTAAVRNRGTPPLADRPSVSSVHMSQVRDKRRWTWSIMRPAVGPWTMSAGPPWATRCEPRCGRSPTRAHGRDVAVPQPATCLARPGPDRPYPEPNRPV